MVGWSVLPSGSNEPDGVAVKVLCAFVVVAVLVFAMIWKAGQMFDQINESVNTKIQSIR